MLVSFSMAKMGTESEKNLKFFPFGDFFSKKFPKKNAIPRTAKNDNFLFPFVLFQSLF